MLREREKQRKSAWRVNFDDDGGADRQPGKLRTAKRADRTSPRQAVCDMEKLKWRSRIPLRWEGFQGYNYSGVGPN